jgi:hypothetical protein
MIIMEIWCMLISMQFFYKKKSFFSLDKYRIPKIKIKENQTSIGRSSFHLWSFIQTHAFKFIIRVVPHTHTHTPAVLGPLSMFFTSTFQCELFIHPHTNKRGKSGWYKTKKL